MRTLDRPAAPAEAAAPVVAPVVVPVKVAPVVPPLDTALPPQAQPMSGSAWLEYPDGSRVAHGDRGDGRRVLLAGAVFDICGTLAGVPVFRFVQQEPLPG